MSDMSILEKIGQVIAEYSSKYDIGIIFHLESLFPAPNMWHVWGPIRSTAGTIWFTWGDHKDINYQM